MVLVYDKLSNAIGILQTKFRYREGHEARRSGLETIPLDQYVEGGHGEGEPGVKIRPDPVHDLFEINWLQVFKRAHTALLGSGGGPAQRTSLVP